jgi:diguanylate cyclase (GGDEF)-like protein
MQKGITGRITLNLIAGILITVVTVSVAILWMSQKQNQQANEATRTMVVGGVEAMERRLQGIANDYGWWEDAYDAYERHDTDWMWSNVGSSVQETNIADLMGIISPEGVLDYGWTLDEEELKASDVLTPDVIEAVRGLTKDMEVANLVARSAYVAAGEGIMMIAVSRITPVSRADTIDPATLPVYVAGFLLSEDRLTDLGKSFLIDDLHLEPVGAGEGPSFPGFPEVVDISGKLIAQFVWTPPVPGFAVLRGVALPIFLALSIFCVVALATAFRTRKMAMALAESEQHAVAASRTDSLTGLINRHGFNQLTEAKASNDNGGLLGIIYLDVNGFKAVNDSIGHHGGDDLVKALADRFNSILPPDSALARVGGDEFAVLLTGKNVKDMAPGVAAALVHSMDHPFAVSGFEFHVSAAVGYACAEHAGVTSEELLRRADLAMYQAKSAAERDPVAYHPTMETGAREKKQVETALRRALEAHELQVFYQPIVRANDLSIVGLEALARWHSPELGTVPPTIFIQVAEETGLIHELGRYILEQVCTDLARWPSVSIAVNVSPVQLRDPSFADDIMAILQRHGHAPNTFELELTEGILVSNPTIAKRKLARLKELGFRLSLDDFGTGFSSIGYLRQFPFDKLKVDRSFVREIGLNPTANALVQALVSLGDAMDLGVVAEGIENEEQLSLLRLVQCEFIQGYYVSKAISASEVTEHFMSAGPNKPIFSFEREAQRAAGAAA